MTRLRPFSAPARSPFRSAAIKVAITGATGFIGQYIVRHLSGQGHLCKCWFRPASARDALRDVTPAVEWVAGELGDAGAARDLVRGCDAVVHGALYRPGPGFRGAEGDVVAFANRNIIGSLLLIEAARREGVPRFVYISTCAVHEVILEDRKLDEAHPMWPTSHYGAHKAAVEEFVYSYGLRDGYEICALRPTGVYGLHHRPDRSKWYQLVKSVAAGRPEAVSERGGKEVHAADVARAVGILLQAPGIAGRAYNCYDRYVSQQDVAHIAARLAGLQLEIPRTNSGPKHQIDTTRIRALGMEFGGQPLLEETIGQLLGS